MIKSLQHRTTIRRYKDKDVSEELLNGLLEQAMRTQTMGNLQLYSVVVTRDDKTKQRLAPAHFNSANDHTGACGAYHLCRFQAYHVVG